MTYEEALDTCRMARKALSMKHPDPIFKDCGFYDEDSITNLVKDLTEKHDIEILMEALEKQIPKKPIRKQRHRLTAFCPTCNDRFDYYEEKTFCFCCQCGQALDWSEEK